MFEPVGDVPKWRPIYDLLRTKNPGDVVTYVELSDAAGFDVLDDRGPLYRALDELLRVDRRSVHNRATVGYEVAEAANHMIESKRHQLKGKRQARRSRNHAKYVRQGELTVEQRDRLAAQELRMAKMETALVNHEGRIQSLERAQEKTAAQVDTQSRELAQINARLRHLGYEVKPAKPNVAGSGEAG